MMPATSDALTETVDALGMDELPAVVRSKLHPICVLRSAVDGLPSTASNLMDLEYHLDPERPFEVLPLTDATLEDTTTIEVLDNKTLAVKQIGADGEPHVVVLSPAQVVHLVHRARSVVYLPGGGPLVTRQ